jgi:hypothetical protein
MNSLKKVLLATLMLVSFIFPTSLLADNNGIQSFDDALKWARSLDKVDNSYSGRLKRCSTGTASLADIKVSVEYIQGYKFEKGVSHGIEDLMAACLIKQHDLWNVYRLGGGAGVRAKMEEIGLGGHSKVNYRPHAGNIFVYMFNNFSAIEVAELVNIKSPDYVAMNISEQDVRRGFISSKNLIKAYGTMLKKRREGLEKRRKGGKGRKGDATLF